MLYSVIFRLSYSKMNLWECVHKMQQKHCVVGSNTMFYRQSKITNMSEEHIYAEKF